MVSRRVHELSDGARPLVDTKVTSPVEIALQEIAAGKLVSVPAGQPEPTLLEEEEELD